MRHFGICMVTLLLFLAPARAEDDQLAIFKKRAEGGDVQAQIALGQMFGFGIGVPSDVNEAAKWSRMAVSQGSPEAMIVLAGAIMTQGTLSNYAGTSFKSLLAQSEALLAEAREKALDRAQAGDPAAEYVVAHVDGFPRLQPPMMPPRDRLLTKSAEKGYLLSQLELMRNLIRKDKGDYNSYLPLAVKTAERGSSEGMMQVAMINRNFLHDQATSKAWLIRAAELNEPAASSLLCSEYGIRVGNSFVLKDKTCNPLNGLSGLSSGQKVGLGIVALGAIISLLPPVSPQQLESNLRYSERQDAIRQCRNARLVSHEYDWVACPAAGE